MRYRGVAAPLALLVLGACLRGEPQRRAWPTTLASHPHAMRRLARLMREQFAAPDPVIVERRIRCESSRVERAIGPDFRVRQQWLTDSLRLEFSSEQFNALGQRLAKSSLSTNDDPLCRALAAEAEAEAPLGGE